VNRSTTRTAALLWIRAVCLLALCGGSASRGDSIITSFDTAPTGSFSPRAGWLAFGGGTNDAGVIADGSAGNGAFHSINWNSSVWGIGNLATASVDLSAFNAISVDARIVAVFQYTGSAPLRFALDLPGGTEWSTSAQLLTGAYQTYVFDLNAMTRTAGNGPLDLSAGTPKFIIDKNGQTGLAELDFDQICGRTTGAAPFEITPVLLNAAPDGDAVRAMWFYAPPGNLRVDDSASAQAVLDFCAQEGVNRLFFSVRHVVAASSQLRDNLRVFLATARASGIQVEALICGIEQYQNPAFIRSELDTVLAVQAATPADTADDFAGVHFDIEFWVSSAWRAASSEAERRPIARAFFDNVLVEARAHLDANGGSGLPIGIDLNSNIDTSAFLPSPFDYNGVNQLFIEHALDLTDTIVLMSYIDFPSGLMLWTRDELDIAAARGRRLTLGADIAPVPPEAPINSFADNFTPTPFSAMTTALEQFHTLLTAPRLAALDGFAVFHYDFYSAQAPQPRSVVDFDGDGNADALDFLLFESYFLGPDLPAPRVGNDADLDGDGSISMSDFARFQTCFTGPDCGCPVPADCRR